MIKRYGKRWAMLLFFLVAVPGFFLTDMASPVNEPVRESPEANDESWTEGGESEYFVGDSYSVRVGKDLYTRYCQVCHGETGQGNGFNAYTLEIRPRDFTDHEYMSALPDRRLAEAIREGGPGVNKSVLMPAWGNTFSTLEINYLVLRIRKFSQPDSIE